MPLWTPEVWDKFSTAGLAMFFFVFHIVAYMRGWFVPGRYHTEIVAALRAENDRLNQRSRDDSEIILVQMKSIAETNVGQQMTAHLLESVREIAEKRRSEQ